MPRLQASRACARIGLVAALAALVPATDAPAGAESGALKASPLVRVTGASGYSADCGTSSYPDSEVEFSLGVHPRNPRLLVGAWIQDAPRAPATAWSRDGGRTWHGVVPPALAACTGSEYLRSSDPWLSVGPDGVAYLVTLPFTQDGPAPAIQVSRSEDTGRSWSAPAFVERRPAGKEPDDKPTLIADPHRAGRAYVTWAHQREQSTPEGPTIYNDIKFSRTGDGARSWSSAVTVDSPPRGWTNAFAQVLVPRRGELLCVWSRRELADDRVLPRVGGRVRFYASRSRDSGRHWSRPAFIGQGPGRTLQDAERSTPIRSGATHVFSAAAQPGHGAYVAWTDVVEDEASRIIVARSPDGGRRWRGATLISQGTDRPLNPDVAVAGDGTVGVRFYDLRDDVMGDAALSARSWLRVSRDGRRFTRERALGGVFDLRTAPVAGGLTPGRFVGEYQGFVGLPDGFATLFAQAQPQAGTGVTDGFFRTVR